MAAKKLKITKNTHHGHLSRAVNSLEAAMLEEPPVEMTVSKYLKMVDEKYTKVVADSEKLQEVITDDEELAKEINDMDTLEDKVIEVKLRAETMLQVEKPSTDSLNATLGIIEQLKLEREIQRMKH